MINECGRKWLMRKRDQARVSRESGNSGFYFAIAAIVGGAVWAIRRICGRKLIKFTAAGLPSTEVEYSRPRRGHEPFDISVGGIAIFFVACGIGALIMHGVLWDWVKHMPDGGTVDDARRWNPAADTAIFQSVAPLQIYPKQDWLLYRTIEESNLNSRVPSNADRRIQKLPIEVTMRRIAEGGLPKLGTNSGISPLEWQRRRAEQIGKGVR